ncbi:hypothetical protein ACFX2G_026349 [Malus domestica]
MRWLITLLNVEGSTASTCESSSMVYVNKLHELPLTIFQINRKVFQMTVGYIMKPSHEEDFAKRGAFPMYPTQGRLMFVPLTFDLPLAPQLQEVDVVLHKATDEIISINLDNSVLSSNSITYSRGCRNCKVRSFEIQQILLGLEDLKAAGCCTIRGPNFLGCVDDFNQSDLVKRLSKAKLALSKTSSCLWCGWCSQHGNSF